jgi:hypothetical protein
MNANKKVTLQMERNYPNIYSGAVYFRNLRTGCELLISIPRDLNSYGISSITLDSGASYTVFPQSFASKLDVQKPLSDAERYYVFRGVGGLSIAFLSLDRIMVGVQDDNSKLEKSIFPFFLTEFAPSITSEGKLLSQERLQPYTEDLAKFICPPFEYHNDYTVFVCSPDEEFPLLKKRLKLEVDTGLDMDYILIGRDWQEEFDILFRAREISIFGR